MEPNNSPRSLRVFMLRLPAPAVIPWLLFLYYILRLFLKKVFIYLFFCNAQMIQQQRGSFMNEESESYSFATPQPPLDYRQI